MQYLSFSFSSSEEIRYHISVGDSPRTLLYGMEDIKWSFQFVIDIEDRSNIATSVAVVGSWPHSNKILIFKPILEAVHYKLMRPSNQLNTVDVVEFRCHFRTKEPASSSWRHGPSFDLFRIWPHQIAEGTLMWDLHSPFNQPDLVHGLNIWGETSMNAKNLALDNSSNS